MSEKRLSLTPNGNVRYQLKTLYRDGTTHVIFEPLDFIARLAPPVGRRRGGTQTANSRWIRANRAFILPILDIDVEHLTKNFKDTLQARAQRISYLQEQEGIHLATRARKVA